MSDELAKEFVVNDNIVKDLVARLRLQCHHHPANKTEEIAAAYVLVSELNLECLRHSIYNRDSLISALGKLMMELADPKLQ